MPEQVNTEKSEHKRIPKKLIITLIIIIALFGWMKFSCRVITYTDFDKYKKDKGYVLYPGEAEGAYDYKCIRRHVGILGGIDAYSFSLSEKDYENYIKELETEYKLTSLDENDLKYGYAHYYGIKVKEINALNDGYILDDFNEGRYLDLISDMPVDEYTVILYDPTGTGSEYRGIFANPDSKRIICYRGGTIK